MLSLMLVGSVILHSYIAFKTFHYLNENLDHVSIIIIIIYISLFFIDEGNPVSVYYPNSLVLLWIHTLIQRLTLLHSQVFLQ